MYWFFYMMSMMDDVANTAFYYSRIVAISFTYSLEAILYNLRLPILLRYQISRFSLLISIEIMNVE
jgi:hypothetical protein